MKQVEPTVRRGVGLALGTALISGLAVYLNAFGVRTVPDPVVYTTAKNLVAALVLLGVALSLPGRVTWPSPRTRDGVGLLAIAVVGGSIPFVLFFSGLAIATAPTAAFIHKTLFVWVALLAVPLLGERLGVVPIVALAGLLAGQAFVAPPTGFGIGPGEVMIGIATAFWSVEVILARRLLARVPVRTLAVARMALGSLVLVGYVALSGRLGVVGSIGAEGWLWIALTGVVLAGYVATWYGALRDAPATVVTSVLVVGAVVTGGLSALTGGVVPNPTVVAGYLVIVGAVALIVLATTGALGAVGAVVRSSRARARA